MSPTLRQTMISLMEQGPQSAQGLASALLLTTRQVEEHLPHLKRSLGQRLAVTPARCRACGYVFAGRARLDAPGRCPRCRQELVEGPWFRVLPA